MDDRQFRWGLSGGASVLSIAGFFWFGISFGVITTRWGWWAWGLSTAFQAAVTASILRGAVQLRRRSGFDPHSRSRSEDHRKTTRRILRTFIWIVVAETILIGLAVGWCVRTGAEILIWPSIGLIVSIHFAPLARLFHVRRYYATAAAGTLILLGGFAGLGDLYRLAFFSG